MKRLLLATLMFALPGRLLAALTDNFDLPDGLITDERAYWGGTGKTSPNWWVTSGALYAKSLTGQTSSPIFRMITRRRDFGDVSVTFRLLNRGLRSGGPALDGVHIFLRHQSEAHTYYVSVNRRDNVVLVKKKMPGGPVNGGTYYQLGSSVFYAVPYGNWQVVGATARNEADGSVTITVIAGGQAVLTARDRGTGGAPIREAGEVGIRTDNADAHFDDFSAASLAGGSPAPSPSPSPIPSPGAPAPVLVGLAKQRFLSPALADGINDAADFGPDAREVLIVDRNGLPVYKAARTGAGTLRWNGRGFDGKLVESGVYIAQIVLTDSRTVYQSISIVR